MSATFSVRRAEAKDASLIRGMRIAALTDAPYAFGAKLDDVLAQSQQSFEEIAQRHSTSDASTSFFLFSDAEPIGTIGAFVEQSENQRAFICALWVAPNNRGTSAASLLVATAAEWLSDRGVSEIFAWVANANTRALAFYEKIGFVATNEVQPLSSNPSQLEALLSLKTRGGLGAVADSESLCVLSPGDVSNG